MPLDPTVDWQAIADYVQFREVVTERFPSWAWALDDPELGPLLQQAAGEEEWSAEVFTSRLKATGWWTSRTAAQREWDIFLGSAGDADIERRIDEARGVLSDNAATLGATLTDAELDTLTRESLRNAWNEDEVTGQLLARSGTFTAGDYTAAQTSVNTLASQYMVSVDDATARSISSKLLSGEMSPQGAEEYMRNIARQRYPIGQITEMIDQGVNLQEYFAPHRQVLANALERNPADIDFTTEFQSVMSLRGDDGTVAPMSLGQVEQYTRTLDEFWETQAGREQKHQMGRSLARQMGVV